MQALILCRGNIGGIRSNPEGYDGAYPAPQQCDIRKLAPAPPFPFSWQQALYRGCSFVTALLDGGSIPARLFECFSIKSIAQVS